MIENVVILGAIALMVLIPLSFLGYLLAAIWKKIQRNPVSVIQVSVIMFMVALLVVGVTALAVMVSFQLFNKRF